MHATATQTEVRMADVDRQVDRRPVRAPSAHQRLALQTRSCACVCSNRFAANSFRNGDPNNMKRYKILLDKKYTFSDTGVQRRDIKYYKKLYGHQKFSGTTNADASAGQNSLWIYLVSTEATNTPTLHVDSRYRYIDN